MRILICLLFLYPAAGWAQDPAEAHALREKNRLRALGVRAQLNDHRKAGLEQSRDSKANAPSSKRRKAWADKKMCELYADCGRSLGKAQPTLHTPMMSPS